MLYQSVYLLLPDRFDGLLKGLHLFLLGTLIVVAFTKLLNGSLKLLLFLPDVHIVTLEVLVFLLGEDSIQLHV